jgi:hypothetical protein
VTWNILVNQILLADFDSIAAVCIDENDLIVPYNLISGDIYTYTAQIVADTFSYDLAENLTPENDQLVIPMPNEVKPGIYKLDLQFGETCEGGLESLVLPLEIYYSKNILVQRWGDVLSVTNENFNGNYKFTAYQWFKNGVAIDGATSSILYIEDGLDLNAAYSVLLTRESDNVVLMSCNADLFDYSSNETQLIVFSGKTSNITVDSKQNARAKIWTTSGLLLKECVIETGVTCIELTKGLFIIEFIFENNHREIHQVVVE